MIKQTKQSVLELSAEEARKFFLKQSSYCSIELPPYFNFNELLKKLDNFLGNNHYNNIKFPAKKSLKTPQTIFPNDLEDTNYQLFANKDGKYAWRPFEIINPVIYVFLVHKITEENNWKTIIKRFSKFQTDTRFECVSLPVKSFSSQSDKAALILQWWEVMEQKSIELALDYSYLYEIDISDCYGSIYTHSIPWALHDKDVAKKRDKRLSGLGDNIDSLIRDMRYGQTNGIPQGSVLMDFISEMVLGYADMLVSAKLDENLNFKILRYRDDYKVFVNNPQDAEVILKVVTEVLSSLGLRLNSSKTKITDCIISGSIKTDKVAWFKEKNFRVNIEQALFLIHQFAKEHPNTGSVAKALEAFNTRLEKAKKFNHHMLSVISILADIAIQNPKYLPICSAVLSRLLAFINDKNEKLSVIQRIERKFSRSTNTGVLDIWLQRVSIPFDRHKEFDEKICKLVNDPTISIWNFSWIANAKLKKLLSETSIVKENVINDLPEVIGKKEYSIFSGYNNSFWVNSFGHEKRRSSFSRRLNSRKVKCRKILFSVLIKALSEFNKSRCRKSIFIATRNSSKNNLPTKIHKRKSSMNRRIKTNNRKNKSLRDL